MTIIRETAARRRDGLALWVGLAVCMGVGPMMLYTLTAISPLVVADLALSPTQYGAVAGVVFGSAAISALFLGGLSGRLSAGAVMVAVSLGSVAGLAVFALARSFAWVVAAAVICGAAQALSNPATNRIVAAQPAERRGALIGWKQSGVQMAQFAAGLLAPAVAALAGWRWAVAIGIVVGVVGVVAALVLRTVSDDVHSDTQRQGPTMRSVGLLTTYTFFMGFGLQATNAWLPLFAHRELGFGVASAGLVAAVIGLVGLVSRIWWAQRSQARASASLFALASGSAAGVALTLLSQVGGDWLVWAGAAVFGAAALASNAVTMVELVRIVPAGALASATGLLVTGMYVGFAAGPVCFGFALEQAGFGVAWVLPLVAFAAAALTGLSSVISPQPHS